MESHSATGPQQVNTYQHAQHAQDALHAYNNSNGNGNGPSQLARGRQARDPLAKTVPYNVNTIDEFEEALAEYLAHPPDEPEHTDCQLSFWIGASFLVTPPSSQGPPQEQRRLQQQQRQQRQQQPQPQPELEPQQRQHPDAPPGFQAANAIQQYAPSPHGFSDVLDPAIALSLSNFQPSPPPPPPPPPPNANGSDSNTNADTAPDNGNGGNGGDGSNGGNGGKKPEQPKITMSILDALQPTSDPKERMRKQRAIAKCCVDSIQKIDGYRYSFHNCWNSREDNAFRFSYYCNDSLLNKDRAANGKGTKLGKRATKPVFDCKGVLSVKFSASKQTLDVFYKHVPMHATYEARAPAPRKDSKRRKFLQETDPEALERIQTRPRAPRVGTDSNAELEWKRKRSSQAFKSQTSLESDLRAESLVNLLDLIRRDIPSEPVYPEPPEAPRPPPPPPRRAPAPIIATVNRPVQQQPSQAPQQPPRKRPRNSCDVCKAKKTKCDGTRPVCQTCIDKKRQCVYSDMNEDRRPSAVEPVETIRQAQAANSELSELERMKKELEEAKARIHELEEERRRTSITPSQTPQMNRQPAIQPPPPPQSQPQPQSDPKPPPVAHPSQRQQKQKQQNHGTQQQQQQKQKPQMQIRNTQSPQAIQQLQNAAQQLQDPQQMSNSQQLQSPQFNHFGNQAPNPYGLSRPMSTQTMPQNMSSNTGHASQSQTNQMSTGLAPTAETSNAYGREFVWPAHQYYGFQAAQQHQPDQWNASRNSGVYR